MIFAVLIVFSMLLVEPCMADVINVTMPDVPKVGPEITSVKIHNTPIRYPPTYATDYETGTVIQTSPEYYIPNGYIEITVKNRPFTPYIDENGNAINTYYLLFAKTLSEPYWNTSPIQVCQADIYYTSIFINYSYAHATSVSSSSIYVNQENVVVVFRVQSVTGHYNPGYENRIGPEWITMPPVFEGEGSSYVYFTLTIPSTDKPGTSEPNIQPTSVAPLSSSTNSQPDTASTSDQHDTRHQNPWLTALFIIIASVCIVTVPIAIVAYLNKQHSNNSQYHKHKTTPKHLLNNNRKNTQTQLSFFFCKLALLCIYGS